MGMLSSATCLPPNHMMATVERFRMIVRVGIMSANRRPTLSVVVVRSMLATSKRCSSYTVRSKARMTRTPLSISRVTWLMRSIFFCIDMKSGMARVITRPMKTPMTGMATRMTAESGTLRRSAMMMPPMAIIGAAMHDVEHHQHHHLHLLHVVGGARDERRRAEAVDLGLREALHAAEQGAAHVAAEPMEVLEPQYTAMMAAITKTSVTPSMRAPTLRM